MAMIYDLDNEGGGFIIGDSDTTGPALTIANFGTGKGLTIQSVVSGSPLDIKSGNYATAFTSPTGASAAALEVNSYAPGYDAISIVSTASGYPINVLAINASYGVRFRSSQAAGRALIVGRSVVGSATVAPLLIQHPSIASGVAMEFQGGFISCTSVDYTASAKTDYVLPISLNGVVRGIPLMSLAGITGGAAVS